MVTAPLPVTRLADVDPAIDVLRRAGATGRGTTLFASLGLHFNVETPVLDAQTITAILKAFSLLEPWLRRNCVRNIQEWLTRFGECYPEVYVRRIVAPDYWPDLEGLADDYLAANPTRKRDLDLLPLLLFLDEARVRAQISDSFQNAGFAGVPSQNIISKLFHILALAMIFETHSASVVQAAAEAVLPSAGDS